MSENISVIKVRNVLLVTVPTDPDDEYISDLQQKILDKMAQYQTAEGVILDISTVDILDSFFARTIVETVQMITLMGGRTIIAGMQPSVAITATQLGLTFENIVAALDVDAAFDIFESANGDQF